METNLSDTVVLANAGAARKVDPGFDIRAGIETLRREKNAVILAHYYQDPEIQDLADYVGDSLDLSRRAQAAKADVIVFCGVRFMAEVAKIINPKRRVLLPDADAGCSLEEACRPGDFRAMRQAHPDHVAISYINCSADVKALSDIIVTSSNAEAIIGQIPQGKPILFAPDKHLGAFLNKKTGRDMLLWDGACIVHEEFSETGILDLRAADPGVRVVAHPECPDTILGIADHVGSTSSILDYVFSSGADAFIIATEPHIIHQMELQAPDKRFIPAPGVHEARETGSCPCTFCPYMAMNTLEKLYLCLANGAPRIEMSEDLRLAALKPLERMLEMSPKAKTAQAAE
ncbi:MAG TPA: quinolinate synthase NadA [Rhodospirillales bacterium]|nr:quinolinate synthase NadA [Rhodospirillales bacterium]